MFYHALQLLLYPLVKRVSTIQFSPTTLQLEYIDQLISLNLLLTTENHLLKIAHKYFQPSVVMLKISSLNF